MIRGGVYVAVLCTAASDQVIAASQSRAGKPCVTYSGGEFIRVSGYEASVQNFPADYMGWKGIGEYALPVPNPIGPNVAPGRLLLVVQ